MATRKTSSKTSKTKTPKADAVVIPPYPGISEADLKSLATKLNKAKDSYRVSDMIRKVNGDHWGSRHNVAWHLVACRAIHPETNPALLTFLEDEPEVPAPEVVVDMLVRLPDGSSERYFSQMSMLMDGYSLTIDNLLFRTYRRAPEVVQARENELNESIRLGLSFVRRRLGEKITPEASASILKQLAKYQASGYGITTNHEMPRMEDGELVAPRMADLAAVKKLALLFGTEKEWNEAFLAAALEGKWSYPKNIRDAFLLASTSQLAQLVNRSTLDTGDTLRTLLEVIPLREVEPGALLDVALTVEQERMREMLLMGVIYRAGKTGAPIPDKLDEVMTFDHLDTTYEGVRAGCIEWFKFFPRERALEAARKLLPDEFKRSRSVGILAAHFDQAILRAALEGDLGKNYISADTLGGLGEPALELLAWAHDQTTGDGQRTKHRAMLYAMGKAAQTSVLDERWDRFIDFDTEGGKPIPYYSSSDSKPREAALRGVPEPRRSVLLLKLLEGTPNPDRILQMAHLAEDKAVMDAAARRIIEKKALGSSFREIIDRLGEPVIDALCKHIGLSQGDGRFLESLKNVLPYQAAQRIDAALKEAGVRQETHRDALVRMASELPGPKTRIYILQVEKEGYDPKADTIARSGGKAPGIADADIPKDKSGEPLTHLFTLDLDEIPELQERYKGARALAAFCPEPNSGDRSDELELVPITREAVAALPHQAAKSEDEDDDVGGRPIAILPLDVPEAIFERSGDDGAGKEIRNMIFNAAGHVLGEPFWIQDDEGGFDDFIMQINEGLCDVNLGDCGSLYVYAGETIFQCH